jgi:hypothetical protein
MNRKRLAGLVFALLAAVLLSYQPAHAQANVGAGSIQGVVTDPQGSVVANAKVTITNKDTGASSETASTSSGTFSSGSLTPGTYVVRVEAPGFKTNENTVTVVVNVITTANTKMELGATTTVVEVTSQAVAVNTDQAQVQGTLTAQQIDNLPVNGRNFLDLAQLEPGVQIQDGSDFDPTKTGFSSISFGGRFGRTARIEVDGVDISDENVGTTTTSIPASAIAEFQLAQSSLDLSTDLTSSGAVNVATKSGTNQFHGQAFGLYRDSTEGAALPGAATYQRSQYGGDVGGPIKRDKLFFFLDGERTLQHAAAGVPIPQPFDSFTGNFESPFREDDILAKLDWQATKSIHLFYRFNYFQNDLVPAFGPPSFSFFGNKNRTQNHVVGSDFNTGTFTHSFRFEYLKFVNNIQDAVRGSGAPLADEPVSLLFPNNGLATGPSLDAPQRTFQSDHQLKYDGSKVWGSHILRYGVAYNHLQGGGFASFFGTAPLVLDFQKTTPYNSFVGNVVTCPGGQVGMNCPLNYIPDEVIVGNGLGFSTELPAFGFPFGGLGPDNRLGLYAGDSWKIKPNLTLTYGVRYVRDTGRTDSDLNTIGVLNNFLPGFGNPVQQQNHSFGPQVGIAWDPKGTGKTVIRSGVGVYYENAIWNNVLFDRPGKLAEGAFFASQIICLGKVAAAIPFADGSSQVIPGGNATCGSAVGATLPATAVSPLLSCAGITTAQCIANFQGAYQASAAANPTGPNSSFIPNQIANGVAVNAAGLGSFFPAYKVPRSIQMNVGFQHELRPGMIISADFIRNVATHYLISIDANHTGDAAFLNVPAAQGAIQRTLTACGAASITAAALPGGCLPLHPISPGDNGAATIGDFANNGLDSTADIAGGAACGGPAAAQNGISFPCAFGGQNPNIGATPFLFPGGRSVYDAMDIKWVDNVNHPFTGVKYLNFQATYTLSRFTNSGGINALFPGGTPGTSDQDFIPISLDNRNPLAFSGDSSLDRRHQFNFGGYAQFPHGFQLGIVSHFWSPLAVTPFINATAGAGAIFQSDFTGDGTPGDPLAMAQTSANCGTTGGTCNFSTFKVGAFGRSLSPGGLANAVSTFNNNIAGQTITPAGQALVNAGLMTEAQLISLGATPQSVAPVVPGQVPLGWLKAFDTEVSWRHSFLHERLTIMPSVSFYNLFNFSNFDSPLDILAGGLSGGAGSISGTTAAQRTDRIGTGTGVFALGSPRAIEWGLKFNF